LIQSMFIFHYRSFQRTHSRFCVTLCNMLGFTVRSC
jgi:hypothetical protein